MWILDDPSREEQDVVITMDTGSPIVELFIVLCSHKFLI